MPRVSRLGASAETPVLLLDSDEDEVPVIIDLTEDDPFIPLNSSRTPSKADGGDIRGRNSAVANKTRLKLEGRDSPGEIIKGEDVLDATDDREESLPRIDGAMAARSSSLHLSDGNKTQSGTVEERLRATFRQIQEDCAEHTKLQLLKAKDGNQAPHPNWSALIDDESPFANLKPIQASSGSGARTVCLNAYHSHHSKKKVDKKHVPFSLIKSKVDRVPKYRYYVHVDRSSLVSDSKQLDYIPFLDERLDEITAELHESYGGRVKDPVVLREKEELFQIKKYLQDILKYGDPEDVTFSSDFRKVFGVELRDILPKSSPTKGPRSSQKTDEAGNVLSSYVDLGCLICGLHQCDIHGEYENSEFRCLQLPMEALALRREQRLARQLSKDPDAMAKTSAFDDNPPCSPECFLNRENNDFGNVTSKPWTDEDTVFLREMLRPLAFEQRAACIIAPCLMKPCTEVFDRIPPLAQEPDISLTRVVKDGAMLKWYDRKRKIITLKDERDLDRRTETHLHHKRGQLRACQHEGLTCAEAGKERCSCLENNVMCEKFCTCPDDCYMRFNGCSCYGMYACQKSSSCACKRLNRECDPDLCHGCGVREAASPFNNGPRRVKSVTCFNCSIQKGAGKKTVVGKSSIEVPEVGPMYGLYLAEPAKKDDFVIEYIGEIISEEEGERRGIIYDAQKLSYMFNLNAECIVDATRMGNASRFINHSSKNANLQVRILLTNLEHRIGFFATTDIPAGTELLFNYGESYTKKYGLKERDQPAMARKSAPTKKREIVPKISSSKGQKKQRGHAGKKAAVDQDASMMDVDVDDQRRGASIDPFAGMPAEMFYPPSNSSDEDYRP